MGVAGMEYNPASPARLEGRSFYLGHLSWVLDAHLSQVLVALPFRDEGVIGLGLAHFDQGTIDEVLEDGTFTGERLGARDFQLTAGLAHPLGERLSVGVKLTVFHKTLGRERAGGAMGSAGLLTSELHGFRFGAACSMRPRPALSRAQGPGAPALPHGHVPRLFHRRRLPHPELPGLSAAPRNFASFGFGTEWAYPRHPDPARGYRRTLEEDDTPDGDRFHYGCGLRVGHYRFDYAFSPKEDFEAVHHVAVTFEFRDPKPDEAAIARDRILAETLMARASAYDSLLASTGKARPARRRLRPCPR